MGEWEKGGRGERHGVTERLRRFSRALLLSSLLPLLLSQTGCWYYSFTGASIPEHLETVAVPLVEDRSLGGVIGIDRQLTDLLIERFAGQTRLVLEPDEADADAVLTAVIESYRNEPTAVTGDEVAALNRVTIAVRVVYRDRVEDEERLSRTFSASEDYAATEIEQEATAAEEVLRQIADDVFTAATSDW